MDRQSENELRNLVEEQGLALVARDHDRRKKIEMAEPEEEEDEDGPAEIEGTPIEEAMEEILGCGTACMSTILSPFLILAMLVFAKETQIPDMYGIRTGDLVCYLLFGLIIAPFQVMME